MLKSEISEERKVGAIARPSVTELEEDISFEQIDGKAKDTDDLGHQWVRAV